MTTHPVNRLPLEATSEARAKRNQTLTINHSPTVPDSYKYTHFCQLLGKSGPYIRGLQRDLGLPIRSGGKEYSDAYLRFMETVVALRTFNVPMNDISDLFEKEKKILQLLHFDSMEDSPTWYMAPRNSNGHTENHLLLTGQDLGFPITSDAVQANLNFREKEPELFAGTEMGEDVRRVLKLYVKRLCKIDERVRSETPVLEDALAWAEHAFVPLRGGKKMEAQ